MSMLSLVLQHVCECLMRPAPPFASALAPLFPPSGQLVAPLWVVL